MDITTRSIGTVSTQKGFCIRLDGKYARSLAGLEGFGHVMVLWYADRLGKGESPTVLDKPYAKGPDRMGVFATRSPARPNGICTTVAPIAGIDTKRGILALGWIDALDGTPVLDIKPYHPSEDRIEEPTVPSWCSHWPRCLEESEAFDWESEFTY